LISLLALNFQSPFIPELCSLSGSVEYWTGLSCQRQ